MWVLMMTIIREKVWSSILQINIYFSIKFIKLSLRGEVLLSDIILNLDADSSCYKKRVKKIFKVNF